MVGILGRKIGMTNVFDKNGHFVPVTLIEAGPCLVLGLRSEEKEGYNAVILGFEEKKSSKTKRPQLRWFERIEISPKRFIKEIRSDQKSSYKVGDKIDVTIFQEGDFVDVTGITIGKGFQGGVRRWGWSGGPKSHGSMFHRTAGSLSASSFPSRIFKGHKMPGHMGVAKRTIQNLKVISVLPEKNLIAVKGAIPGHKGGIVVIKEARKKPKKKKNEKEK